MSLNFDGANQESIGHCSVCGHLRELVQVRGTVKRFCFGCRADVAIASLLITEIDALTLAGRNADALVAECTEISSPVLDRAQSAELGFWSGAVAELERREVL
jgi:hypothetical protein